MVIRTAIDTNIRLSRAAQPERPQDTSGGSRLGSFDLEVDRLIRALPDGATVLDLGGGIAVRYGDGGATARQGAPHRGDISRKS